MKLSNAQRDLVLELLHSVGAQVPALLEAWKEAGDAEPPPESNEPLLFTSIRRIPCDMKPEDGSLRYCQPAPFPGATVRSFTYFYEAALPPNFPSLLIVVSWNCPAETVMATQPTQPPGEA